MVLPTLAALLGAAVAGFGLLHAAPDITTVPPGYVALVNNRGILLSDFQAQTASVTGKSFAQTTSAERDKTLHDMIDEELLVQRGMVLDLAETTTEVREVMTAAVNAQMDAGTRGQPPSDAQLQEFYQSHRLDYATLGTMSLRDLVLHVGGYQDIDQSTAQAETRRCRSDLPIAFRRTRRARDATLRIGRLGTGGHGRDPGCYRQAVSRSEVVQVAETLTDGQVSDPVTDSDGVHVLVMEQRYPPRVSRLRQRARQSLQRLHGCGRQTGPRCGTEDLATRRADRPGSGNP